MCCHVSCGAPVTEHLGWEAIGRALGCCRVTARRLFIEEGLPCYKKVRPYGWQRWCWATTTELITVWQLAKSKVDRADELAARDRRRAAATVADGIRRDG